MNKLTKKYITNLSNSKQSTQYLLDRHLTPQTIKKFGLGLSLSMEEEINNVDADRLGLIPIYDKEVWENGRKIIKKVKSPFYHDRIMIPIKDNNGGIAGFTARTLFNIDRKYQTEQQVIDNLEYKNINTQKYKNSKTSKGFDKSTILYNLWCIGNNKSIALFEAQMNVQAFDQYVEQLPKELKNNTPHPVATGGTALTQKHIQELKNRGVETVFIAFDGDKAGRRATIRAIKLLRDEFIVWVMVMPHNKDMMDLLPNYKAIAELDTISGDEYLIREMERLKKLYKKYINIETNVRNTPTMDMDSFWKWWRVDSVKLIDNKRKVLSAYDELERLIA